MYYANKKEIFNNNNNNNNNNTNNYLHIVAAGLEPGTLGFRAQVANQYF